MKNSINESLQKMQKLTRMLESNNFMVSEDENLNNGDLEQQIKRTVEELTGLMINLNEPFTSTENARQNGKIGEAIVSIATRLDNLLDKAYPQDEPWPYK